MTAAPHSIDPTTYLDDLLAQASPDLMRQMLQGFINQILSAQADTVCGAEYVVVSTERVNHRNGYRHRALTPLSARSTWRCRNCATARSSQTGC